MAHPFIHFRTLLLSGLLHLTTKCASILELPPWATSLQSGIPKRKIRRGKEVRTSGEWKRVMNLNKKLSIKPTYILFHQINVFYTSPRSDKSTYNPPWPIPVLMARTRQKNYSQTMMMVMIPIHQIQSTGVFVQWTSVQRVSQAKPGNNHHHVTNQQTPRRSKSKQQRSKRQAGGGGVHWSQIKKRSCKHSAHFIVSKSNFHSILRSIPPSSPLPLPKQPAAAASTGAFNLFLYYGLHESVGHKI